VLLKLQKFIDDTIEEWSAAFDGPPEAQMEALEILADVRAGLASLCLKEEGRNH
jgi:hypothetical protein